MSGSEKQNEQEHKPISSTKLVTRKLKEISRFDTRRFATTIFNATQRRNIGTKLKLLETMSQQCHNAVLD